MSSTNPTGSTYRGGSSTRGNTGRGGRGRGANPEGYSAGGKSYQAGTAPYQKGERGGRGGQRGGKRGGDRGSYRGAQRGGRGGNQDRQREQISAEDQFDMLFGGNPPKKETAPPKKSGNADDLMNLLGAGDDAIEVQDDAIIVEDDAIIVEDDAIIVEEEVKVAEKPKKVAKKQKAPMVDPKLTNLTDEELAILNAAQQKPLWVEEGRVKYTQQQMFDAFTTQDNINFDLFDEDYMSVYDVFSQGPQIPFGQDQEACKGLNVRGFQDKPGGGPSKRFANYGAGAKGSAPPGVDKKDWNKGTKTNVTGNAEDEEDLDPDWIDFDPEKTREKFFGHVMEDEQALRDNVVNKKKAKEERAEQRKQKAADMAKQQKMTGEQIDMIAESKKVNAAELSQEEQTKLKEAELLAAQIEAESFSQFDQEFEKKRSSAYQNKHQAETLTDDQLVDLFSEMKRETLAKREQKMKKFKIETPQDTGGLDLIDEFNDELDAMRGADSEPEDGGMITGGSIGKIEAGSPFRVGVAQPYQANQALEALEDDEVLEEEEGDPIKHYSDELKEQLQKFREQKAQRELQNKVKTAESNLQNIFSTFQTVTQQRHKVKLEEINNFQQDTQSENQLSSNLISSIFSQINPFSQYVIQDIQGENQKQKEEEVDEEEDDKNWTLHENLFQRGPDHQVDPKNLVKSSYQMFSVYKYYENPSMLVKSKYHNNGNQEFVEVRELVPKIKFFDAPVAPSSQQIGRELETEIIPEIQVV